jgi:F420-dependent oxidoreductase-like protein
MRLGLNLAGWGSTSGLAGSATSVHDNIALAVEADRLGYDIVWAAEAFGYDAVSTLAYIAARTTRIGIGAGVMQIPGRSPAMTAMTAAGLDAVSGGRFHLGLGVSGPQVSEGWHGVLFDQPISRTREYLDVVRLALRRAPLRYSGKHIHLPLPDRETRPIRLAVPRSENDIPIYLAALGPKNLELAGEIADGWLAIFFSPEHGHEQLDRIRAGRHGDLDGFDVCAYVPLAVGESVSDCADRVRGYAALYVGGMGSRTHNFYNALATRMGFGKAAATIQDRYLARDYAAAEAAVPQEFIDSTALIGPLERIAERLQAYAEAGVTTIAVSPFGQDQETRLAALRAMADAYAHAGLTGTE